MNLQGIAHVAIATTNLDRTKYFYSHVLGAEVARCYEDRVTFKFCDYQLVCHLSDSSLIRQTTMYPYHFGFTFIEHAQFDSLYQRLVSLNVSFYKPVFIRFQNLAEEHLSFVIQDPDGHYLEFKHYIDPAKMY